MIVWVLVILVIRVAAGLKARRHEAVVIGHGVLNKVAGATAFVAFVWAVWCGSFSVPLTAVALCVATFAALAEAGSRA